MSLKVNLVVRIPYEIVSPLSQKVMTDQEIKEIIDHHLFYMNEGTFCKDNLITELQELKTDGHCLCDFLPDIEIEICPVE